MIHKEAPCLQLRNALASLLIFLLTFLNTRSIIGTMEEFTAGRLIQTFMVYFIQIPAFTSKYCGLTPTNSTPPLLKNRILLPLLPAGGTTDLTALPRGLSSHFQLNSTHVVHLALFFLIAKLHFIFHSL